MTIDVIAYNALARSIDAKKDQIAEQRCLRDSAIAAQISLDSDIQYYQDLIDSATAYIPTILIITAADFNVGNVVNLLYQLA
jgi:hypothetical protein